MPSLPLVAPASVRSFSAAALSYFQPLAVASDWLKNFDSAPVGRIRLACTVAE